MTKWFTAALFLLLSTGARAGFEEIRELIRRGLFAEAVAASDAVLKSEPRDFRVWTLKGIALQSLSRPAESLTAFRKALEIQPSFLPALQSSAQLEYETGDPQAKSTLERVIALRDDPAAHAMLGVLAFERKDCRESVAHFGAAAELIPQQPLARWQFASCLFELGRYGDAEGHFSALLEQRENDQVRYNLGLSRFAAGRYPESIAALEPLSRRDNPDADTLSLLAAAYEASGQTPAAVTSLRRAIDAHPDNERLYIDLAGLCLEHNSINLGLEVMQIGVRNIPDSARIETVLGLMYVRAGDTDKAATHYKRASELDPREGFGPVAQAMTLLQMGAPEEAIELLRTQRSRGAANPQVDLTLARALLQNGNDDSVLPEVEKLLDGAGADADARVLKLRAKLYQRRKQEALAAAALEAALKLEPDDRTSAYQLMLLYRRLGRMKEAAALEARVKDLLDSEKQEEQQANRFQLVAAPDLPRKQ